jgi:hypothetical protein
MRVFGFLFTGRARYVILVGAFCEVNKRLEREERKGQLRSRCGEGRKEGGKEGWLLLLLL